MSADAQSESFVGPDADVILRSSDGIEFPAHKLILSYASPVFKDMFQIGDRMSSNADTPESRTELPIIDLTEPQHVLYEILHHCYPIPHHPPTELQDLVTLIGAAAKYDMQGVISLLEYQLRTLCKTQILPVFAVACRFGFETLAQDAARLWKASICPHSLASQVPGYEWSDTTIGATFTEEMIGVRAGSYFRLAEYLRTDKFETFCAPDVQPPPTQSPKPPSLQIEEYLDADLKVQSIRSIDCSFLVHQTILSIYSPVLKNEIDTMLESRDLTSQTSQTNLPVLLLPECDNTLRFIIGSCYPSGIEDIRGSNVNVTDLPDIVAAAKKYQLKNLISFVRRLLPTYVISDPLSAYCVAVQYGWKPEARDAAIRLARLKMENIYSPFLESFNTEFYFPLLKFCHEYRRIVGKIAGDSSGGGLWESAKWLWDEHEGDARELAWTTVIYTANTSAPEYRRSSYSSLARNTSNALTELRKLDQSLRSGLLRLHLEIPWPDSA